MTFTISSGTMSYTLPLDPQHYTYQIKPRYGVQKTLGGQVVQLLGYSVAGSFSGIIHNHMVSRQDAWNDMYMFSRFMTDLMKNQQQGVQSHVYWFEEGYDWDCALGDLQISESIETTGLQYELPFFRVSKSVIKNASERANVMSKLLEEIGFDSKSYHGGDGKDALLQRSDIKITGFKGYGATVDSSASTDDVSLSSDSSIKELQEYAIMDMHVGRIGDVLHRVVRLDVAMQGLVQREDGFGEAVEAALAALSVGPVVAGDGVGFAMLDERRVVELDLVAHEVVLEARGLAMLELNLDLRIGDPLNHLHERAVHVDGIVMRVVEVAVHHLDLALASAHLHEVGEAGRGAPALRGGLEVHVVEGQGIRALPHDAESMQVVEMHVAQRGVDALPQEHPRMIASGVAHLEAHALGTLEFIGHVGVRELKPFCIAR